MQQLDKLLAIMRALRDPVSGCPWDIKQNFQSIAPYTVEEAYEVADAIAREDYAELKDELGDLLLQVVFHAQMAAEQDCFDFGDVVTAINEKMIRRHPHVFAAEDAVAETSDGSGATTTQVKIFWEQQKARERAAKDQTGLLAGVALALPALVRAQKLQKRAATAKFDWADIDGVWEKLYEELGEVKQAMASEDKALIVEELGDLLFSCVNLSRFVGVDAEDALRGANCKFENRFKSIESQLAAKNKTIDDCSVEELETFWEHAKKTGI